MKKILQLLGILTFVICNYGNAKELKCEYELKNLNIEPVRVANAKRTYTVYISCKYTSVHHTGETGGPIPLRKTITPVVTGTDDEKEGKAEAYAEGESTIIASPTGSASRAHSRLLMPSLDAQIMLGMLPGINSPPRCATARALWPRSAGLWGRRGSVPATQWAVRRAGPQ